MPSVNNAQEPHADPPQRNRRRAIVLSVLGVLLLVLAAGSWYVYRGLTVPVQQEAPTVEVQVSAGQSVRSVAAELHSRGLIRSARLLEWYARVTGQTGNIQSGYYALSAADSARSILQRLTSGAVIDRSLVVTFPEGWTIQQISERLDARGIVEQQQFAQNAVMQQGYRDLEVLGDLQDEQDLQGYLFPDSYRFEPDSNARSVVRRMVNRLAQNLPHEWQQTLAEQGRTLHEVLTLASIVQAEALEDDVSEVAGVFWNRLRSGWRLESDATVNFALGTSKRQPTFADTYVEHPYNTYRFAGLPPGPIGNPGREAIEASLDPPDSDYFFFLHKNNGDIVLSRTFSEHLAAKARYLD
ncbi:MAG: endolytic transglycosylase MltG [Spirochaetaceae bacterium]|nr:MAG: endolytic transglycosylase MltG [Spirochaetaceae bacterium]